MSTYFDGLIQVPGNNVDQGSAAQCGGLVDVHSVEGVDRKNQRIFERKVWTQIFSFNKECIVSVLSLSNLLFM